jgi:hypothetical protein
MQSKRCYLGSADGHAASARRGTWRTGLAGGGSVWCGLGRISGKWAVYRDLQVAYAERLGL